MAVLTSGVILVALLAPILALLDDVSAVLLDVDRQVARPASEAIGTGSTTSKVLEEQSNSISPPMTECG